MGGNDEQEAQVLLRDIYRAWTGEGILEQTLDEFKLMIGGSKWMFSVVSRRLWIGEFDEFFCRSVFERDVELNKLERKIRKQIVEHLALNPGQDVNYCLLLMSVIKDAERLGDQGKNMIDVSRIDPEIRAMDADVFVPEFRSVFERIEPLFDDAILAFEESDEVLGRRVIETATILKQDLKGLTLRILDADLPSRRAVGYTLTARFLKRIVSHLSNVATSVVMPLHKVDYFDESELEQ